MVPWRQGVIPATRVIVSHLKEGKKSEFSGGGVGVARGPLHRLLSEPLGRGMIFLSRPRWLSYSMKGMTVGGDSGLVSATQVVFPGAPLQLCVRHVDEFHVYYFNYRHQGPTKGVARFLELTHRLLYAKSLGHLKHLIQEYLAYRQDLIETGFGQEIKNFERKFDYLWTHLKHPGMPRTTNIIENIIHQLSRKINRTDGFRSAETACNSLQLLIMKYRFHTFTCSRIKGHNGYSPLSLAKAKTSSTDWITFSQKKHH